MRIHGRDADVRNSCDAPRDAARAVGARMAGVDLVHDLDRGELVVLEVNAVPGWRALADVTGIDVAAAILAELRDSPR